MRTKSSVVLALFLIPALCQAQEKKDTKIIVTVADTAGLFDRIQLALFEDGFSIKQGNKELGIIATNEKAVKHDASADIRLMARIKENTITFFGEIASNISLSYGGAKSEKAFIGLYYGGMKKSSLRLAWDEMLSIAKQFGSEISYSK